MRKLSLRSRRTSIQHTICLRPIISGPPMPGRKPAIRFPVWKIEHALTVCISQALPGDAADLAKIHARALPPGWPAADIAAFCGNSSRIVLKAVEGAALLGFAILQFA